jgi:rubrerythrin
MEEKDKAELRAKARAETEANYKRDLEDVHKHYKPYLVDGCDFCCGLPRGANDLKYSSAESYGLTVDYAKDTANCPSCGRLMAQWGSG